MLQETDLKGETSLIGPGEVKETWLEVSVNEGTGGKKNGTG